LGSHSNFRANNGNAVTAYEQRFGYDNLDRPVTVTQSSNAAQYTHDATGNRTARSITAASYTNTVSPTSNRLTQVQQQCVLGFEQLCLCLRRPAAVHRPDGRGSNWGQALIGLIGVRFQFPQS
jgi:YD repeat-containing protein